MSPLVRRLLINHLLEKRAYRLEKQAERSWGETIGDPLSLIGGVTTGIGGTNVVRNFNLPHNNLFGGAEIEDVYQPKKNKFSINEHNVKDWWTIVRDHALRRYREGKTYDHMNEGKPLTAQQAAELNELGSVNRKELLRQAAKNLKEGFKGVPKSHYATLLGGLGTLGLGSVMSGAGRAARESHDLEQAFLAGQASVPRRRGLFS
jgi:hypothetical protein